MPPMDTTSSGIPPRPRYEQAPSAISAAVVGVILNLAVWFALHVLFREVRAVEVGPLALDLPNLASVDLPAVALSLLAALAIFRLKMGVIPVLLGCAALGVTLHLAGLT